MSYKFVATTTPTLVGAIISVGIVGQIISGSTNYEDLCGRVPIYERAYGISINQTVGKLIIKNATSQDNGDFRILHGMNAILGEWPFIARINMCEDGRCRSCTGSLMNSRWILSAGHCGQAAKATQLISKVTVSVGLYDLVVADSISRTVDVDKVIVHPDYSADPLVDDLALFRLVNEVEFNDHILPVCLIGEETKDVIPYAASRECYVVGYGMIENDNFAVKLQKLQVGVREPDACNGDTRNDISLVRNTLCIGPKSENQMGSSCRGDSGGPNVCYEPETNRWKLFGTVSYGPSVCDREAGDQWLSVATDLAAYRTWILETMKAES